MDNSDISAIILESTSSGGAEVIDLSKECLGFRIKDSGFEKFLNAVKSTGPLPNVRFISLAEGDIHDISIDSLVNISHYFPNLSALDLASNHIGEKTQSSAAQILNNFPKLTKLYLSGNPTVFEGNQLLAQAAANHRNIIGIELLGNELDGSTESRIESVTLGHQFIASNLLEKAKNNNGVLSIDDYHEFGLRIPSIIAESKANLAREEDWHMQLGSQIRLVSDNALRQDIQFEIPAYYQKYVNAPENSITANQPANLIQVAPISPVMITQEAKLNPQVQVSASP